MSAVAGGFRYIRENWERVSSLFGEHLLMSGMALLIALIIALPTGVLLVRYPRVSGPVLGFLSLLYTIPSLALLILLIPVFGLGADTAIITLIIYAQIILVRNIVAGLRSINPVVLDAARGVGMSSLQRWWKIELPLAAPIILAGVRIAAVMIISVAAIASKINAGGLGDLLFRGIAQGSDSMIWAGAISVSFLALVVNFSLLAIERLIDPKRKISVAAKRTPSMRLVEAHEQSL